MKAEEKVMQTVLEEAGSCVACGASVDQLKRISDLYLQAVGHLRDFPSPNQYHDNDYPRFAAALAQWERRRNRLLDGEGDEG